MGSGRLHHHHASIHEGDLGVEEKSMEGCTSCERAVTEDGATMENNGKMGDTRPIGAGWNFQ